MQLTLNNGKTVLIPSNIDGKQFIEKTILDELGIDFYYKYQNEMDRMDDLKEELRDYEFLTDSYLSELRSVRDEIDSIIDKIKDSKITKKQIIAMLTDLSESINANL
jgi:hypothetical protein